MTSDEALPIAGRIAAGHAFDKHVVENKEFTGIALRGQFQDMILEVLPIPTRNGSSHEAGTLFGATSTPRSSSLTPRATRTGRPSGLAMARSIFSLAYNNEMETASKSGPLVLALNREELRHLNNALNEVCNGVTVANFEAAIGLTKGQAGS